MTEKKLNYLSLFSSAGVGCYGFKQSGFECIASNELIFRRLEIQKYNNKCTYSKGYVQGDITTLETKKKLDDAVSYYKNKKNIQDITLIVATPPCQGISVANHKKNINDLKRNSLVVESILIVKKYKPMFFVFENVARFMKTICTDVDNVEKPIKDAIDIHLKNNYTYQSKVINFKDYGANSSRTRTLVIGIRSDLSSHINIDSLYPNKKKVSSLQEVIGHLPRLTVFGQKTEDIYHFFRKYPIRMKKWIENLPEGKTAFDNTEPNRIPHKIIDGQIVFNQRKNSGKYTRQRWDKVAPCIHTRNDQLASQNTVHPSDDRVFSIRELMLMMNIPKEFNWVKEPLEMLNAMDDDEKDKFLKKHEINIRQSVGEAVPTVIFKDIGTKIKEIINGFQNND